MAKKIVKKDELFEVMVEAMEEIASIVKTTLGPGGRTVLIQRYGQALNGEPLGPKITKDGVSVANECESDNPIKDLVIQSVKHICKKTNIIAGDGTTTAIVLGEALVKATLTLLKSNPTLNPQLVRESVEQELKLVIQKLKNLSIPIKDYEMISQVASISANGDHEIGQIIGQAFEKVGVEGVVTVDEGNATRITLDLSEGYQISKGAEAQDRFFNNSEKTKFEATNVALIIFDGSLVNYVDLIPALKTIAGLDDSGKPTKGMPPVVVLANEFSMEVIQFLLIQKAEAGLQFCCVKGPHMTNVRTGYYGDIAVMSGGTKLGNGDRSLKNFQPGDEGIVQRVVIDKYKCTFYDGQGSEEDILARVDQLKAMRSLAESPYDAQVVNDRLAALTNGIAKIGVGGSTEFEVKEKYDRIEDALNAARAAIQEGVVSGGGVTLLRIAEELEAEQSTPGKIILSEALRAPFRQILENIGVESEYESIKDKILKNPELTYDARLKEMVNFMEAGIIDPVKVTRTALENAVSIASLLTTAGGGIIFVKD